MNENLEGLKEWEQVQPPRSSSSHQSHSNKEWELLSGYSIPTPLPSYSDDCTIFPPSNHEGLHIEESQPSPPPPPPQPPIPSPSRILRYVEPFPLQPSSSVNSSARAASEFAKRKLKLFFEVLCSKLLLLLHNASLPCFSKWAVGPFAPAAAAAGLLGVFLYLRRRRRRRPLSMDRDSMIRIIREHDECDIYHQARGMEDIIRYRVRTAAFQQMFEVLVQEINNKSKEGDIQIAGESLGSAPGCLHVRRLVNSCIKLPK